MSDEGGRCGFLVTPSWAILVAPHNYIVAKRREYVDGPTGEKRVQWQPQKYYSDLAGASEGLFEQFAGAALVKRLGDGLVKCREDLVEAVLSDCGEAAREIHAALSREPLDWRDMVEADA